MTNAEFNKAFKNAKGGLLWWDASLGMLLSKAYLQSLQQYSADMPATMEKVGRAMEEIKHD